MPGSATAAKLTELEQAMAELALAQARTEASLGRYAAETRERQARKDAEFERSAAEERERQARKDAEFERSAAEERERQARKDAEFERYATEERERRARVDAEFERSAAEARERQERTEANLDRLSADLRAGEERSRREWRKFRRDLGEQSRKMGTLVEDIVAPGIPRIFRTVFKVREEPECVIRAKLRHRKDPSRMREFDALARAGGFFLVTETKSRLAPQDVSDFVKLLPDVRSYWSNADGQTVVGALASFYVDASVVTAGERAGLLMIGLGTGLLRILNSPGFKPREW